jgi:hypothetical protein
VVCIWHGVPVGAACLDGYPRGRARRLPGAGRIRTGMVTVARLFAFAVALPEILGFSYGVAGSTPLGFKGMLSAGRLSAESFTEPNQQILKLQLAIGAVVGLSGWLAFSFAASRSAWPGWLVSRSWLAIRGQVPWRLTTFLADAHMRGIVRQQGAAYQFRHLQLQHRLASRAATTGRAPTVTSPEPAIRRSWMAWTGMAIIAVAVTTLGGAVLSIWQSQPTTLSTAEHVAQTSAPTVIFTCTGAPAVRPSSYLMACGTGQEYLKSLRWSEWTSSGAFGAAEAAEDNCIPDCAAGTFVDSPVLVSLSEPRVNKNGVRYFSVMIISGPSIFSYSLRLGRFGANLY